MNLASHYAAVLSEGADVGKTIAYLKRRGHLSLLGHIVRALEREPAGRSAPEVLVARNADAKKHAKAVQSALAALGAGAGEPEIRVDERAVGGWRVRVNSKVVDRTFRAALVSMYQKAVRSDS